jgi:hypothetical protein
LQWSNLSHPACGWSPFAKTCLNQEQNGADHFSSFMPWQPAKCPLVLVKVLLARAFPKSKYIHKMMVKYLLTLLYIWDTMAGASIRLLLVPGCLSSSTFLVAMTIPDPVKGLLPIEWALLNVRDNGLLKNMGAIDALSSCWSGFFCLLVRPPSKCQMVMHCCLLFKEDWFLYEYWSHAGNSL